MNLEPGSEESLKILKAMIGTSNTEIFRGDLKILVDYKWDQMRRQVIGHLLVCFMYVLGVTFNQIWPVREFKIALLTATILLLFREGLQMHYLKKEYFSIWNSIDLSG